MTEDLPQCEAQRLNSYYNDTPATDKQCRRAGRFMVDGGMYCRCHAEIAAEEQVVRTMLAIVPRLGKKSLAAIIHGCAANLPDPFGVKDAEHRVANYNPNRCLACGEDHGSTGLPCPSMTARSNTP